MTRAPSRAKRMAAALPLPRPGPREPAPVTIAILPFSRSLMASLRPPRGRIPSDGARGYHAPAVKRVLIAEFAEPVDPPPRAPRSGCLNAPSLFSTRTGTRPQPLQNHTSNAREPIAASDDGTSVTPPWPRTMMLRATAPSGPLDIGQLRVQPGGPLFDAPRADSP